MKKLISFFAVLLLIVTPGATAFATASSSTNLISNPSVEIANKNGTLPIDWQKDKWGSNTASFSYKKNNGYSGSKSLYVNVKKYTSGDAKWYFTPVAVKPNTSYTYKDYYLSSTWTDVLAKFIDNNGAVTYKWLTGVGSSSSWKLTTSTFTTPANTAYLSVLHIISGVGTLQTDDFSLSEATLPSPPIPGGNVVPNPSLETPDSNNPAKPKDWQTNSSKVNTPVFSYLNSGHNGSRSVEVNMTNYTSGDAFWSYGSQPVNSNKLYEFTDYYKSNVDTEVYADVVMNDGSEQWMYVGTAWHTTGWNRFYAQFTMPAGAVSANVYHTIFAVGYLITDDYDLHQYSPIGFNWALVSITFDDSIRSTYTYGLPALQKYGFHSTMYMLSGYTDDPYYMDVNMMEALKNNGEEIASHTVTHPHLINIAPDQLDYELSQSQQDLANWTGAPTPTDFASPYGEYNAETLAAIKKYYSSHRSVDVGYNSKNNFDIYDIKVQNVLYTTTLSEIQNWIDQAAVDHTWLVLVYHAVEPNTNIPDSLWNTTPNQLDAQFAAIKNSGIAVETVQQALDELTAQL